MVLKRGGLALGVLILASLALARGAEAATVSVMVVRAGANTDKVGASDWESGIMDAFFNAGHIVSNARALALPQLPEAERPEEFEVDFQEAEETGADYFVLALLEYEESNEKSGKPRIREVTLRLYRMNPREPLRQETLAGRRMIESDNFQSARKAMLRLIPYMGASL